MKTELRNEIEKFFALQHKEGAYLLSCINQEHAAWVMRKDAVYGVFVIYDGSDIYESFSGAIINNTHINIEGLGERSVLILTSTAKHLRNEFSLICEDLVNPGVHGEKREELLCNPLKWWERWKNLLGNAETNKMVYDVVGELWAVLKLLEEGKRPYWSASRIHSHDIEMDDESYEVKSTIKKEGAVIHASSQHQFNPEGQLYLIFTRLEESLTGLSIDDLLKEIERYDSTHIKEYNEYLETNGFGKGNHFRKQKYVILERNKYNVDDSFPRITESMFKGDTLPKGITHIEYNISLDGLEHENWK